MFARLMVALLAVVMGATGCVAQEEPTSETNVRLREALARYPQADTNGDGILTMTEARAFLAQHGGQPPAETGAEREPAPTHANVAYGPHPRNVLDFWEAGTTEPAPVIVFIHGGGFVGGDKSRVNLGHVRRALGSGASFAAINYRFRAHAPIQDILRDTARAIQFLRHQAATWRIDPARIAAYGSSAGAGSSIWLAFHDDLADPEAEDPVLSQSSRLAAAGMLDGQFSYDLLRWTEVFGVPLSDYGEEVPQFYHLTTLADLETPEAQRVRASVDMESLVTPDDPPIYISCRQPGGEITDRGHLLHHPTHAIRIKEACDRAGVRTALLVPRLDLRQPADAPTDPIAFLLSELAR